VIIGWRSRWVAAHQGNCGQGGGEVSNLHRIVEAAGRAVDTGRVCRRSGCQGCPVRKIVMHMPLHARLHR